MTDERKKKQNLQFANVVGSWLDAEEKEQIDGEEEGEERNLLSGMLPGQGSTPSMICRSQRRKRGT